MYIREDMAMTVPDEHPEYVRGDAGSVSEKLRPWPSSRTPRVINGRYFVRCCLGVGTHARVLGGWDNLRRVKVALKQTSKCNNAAVRTARNEVDVHLHVMKRVCAVERANVVSLDAIVETEKELYLVAERMPGDLHALLGTLCEHTTRWIFRDVVAGMLQLKAAGVAHRGIHPSNILVDEDARCAKLTDFGSSTVVTGRGGGVVPGMPRVGAAFFAAPEARGATGCYDVFQADLFSLGATLYCVHVGWAPTPGRPFPESPPAAAAAMSPELQDLIGALTARQPAARPLLEDVASHPWLACTPASRAPSTTTSVDGSEDV